MIDPKPILEGCEVLPPLEPSKPASHNENKPLRKAPRSETANRFAVLNSFVDVSLRELTKAETAVWLVLYRDTRNGTARTSQADIARRAGLSVRAVKGAIKRLIKCGLLRRIWKGGLNRGPSIYRVIPTAG